MDNFYQRYLLTFIAAGKNLNYRKIKNNTYAVKTTNFDLHDVVGVQLHRTLIGYFDLVTGNVHVYTGGWNTVTTRDRINNFLKLANIDGYVNTKKGQLYFNRDGESFPIDNGVTFDSKGDIVEFDNTVLAYADPDVSHLCQKNSRW